MSNENVLREPIGIIGAGVAGLINAHVLLQDGFTDVTLITRDKTVGGTWARERVYPGLHINNVHGEYRFSCLDMPLPENFEANGGRLSGMDMSNYVEKFSATFLDGKAKFIMQTEILNVERDEKDKWQIHVEDLLSKQKRTLSFSRIILASGGCSRANIPESLSQDAADKAGYKGLVVHSSEFAAHLDGVLAAVKPTKGKEESGDDEDDIVLVVGGGKSAQDMSSKLANEGRKVALVFETTDVFLGTKTPLPDFIRKSRFLSVFSAHMALNTRLERFLHKTSLGATITEYIWQKMGDSSFDAFEVPKDSPLRRADSLFWSVRLSDEGNYRSNSFHSLVNAGVIEAISPARVVGYADDGKSVLLNNGRTLRPKAVLLATGYKSSWSNILTPTMMEELGMNRHAPTTTPSVSWDYTTLRKAPPVNPENKLWVTSIYRGLVPAKNIERRDFAIAGATFTVNPGYTNEVVAHWITSYFRGDKMRLPATAQEAIAKAEEKSAWMKVRFPAMVSWVNESYSTSFDFWTWPQAADELLEDMCLPSMRSGGNFFNWAFKVIDAQEIATLTEERRAIRASS